MTLDVSCARGIRGMKIIPGRFLSLLLCFMYGLCMDLRICVQVSILTQTLNSYAFMSYVFSQVTLYSSIMSFSFRISFLRKHTYKQRKVKLSLHFPAGPRSTVRRGMAKHGMSVRLHLPRTQLTPGVFILSLYSPRTNAHAG